MNGTKDVINGTTHCNFASSSTLSQFTLSGLLGCKLNSEAFISSKRQVCSLSIEIKNRTPF